MKTTSLFRFFSVGIVAVCCIAGSLLFTGCGDDDKDDTIQLPTALYKQWLAPGDGMECSAVVYDLTSKAFFTIMQQPTAAYAAKAGMNANYFYTMSYRFPYTAEIDVKTGVIYLTDKGSGTMKVTDLTDTSAKFDGVACSAVTEKITSAGNWKIAEEPIVE